MYINEYILLFFFREYVMHAGETMPDEDCAHICGHCMQEA